MALPLEIPPRARSAMSTSKASPMYNLRSSIASTGSTTSLTSLFAGTGASLPRDIVDDIKSVIHHAFVPHIAVHVSDDVDEVVREKGLPDFYQLIRPYGEKVQGRITARDSQGSSVPFEDFAVRFVRLSDVVQKSERKGSASGNSFRNGEYGGTNAGIPEAINSEELPLADELLDLHLSHAEELIDTNLATETESHTGQAFYLLYLRKILSGFPVTPHETWAHPVACLIAISSRNTTPIDTLRQLYKSGSEVNVPGYVNKEYLRYYVLVHDEDKDDIVKSAALFEQMKRHFGLHCHLIRLRSTTCIVSDEDSVPVAKSQWLPASEELADLHAHQEEDIESDTSSRFIHGSDEAAIKTMVREMVAQSVIPFMERNIASWNDQILSRRKGIGGRVLSFSRRFLGSTGTRSTSSSATASNFDSATNSYDPMTPEAQMRKLADWSFMLRDWKLAYDVYNTIRTDFNNDKAWLHVAGAQEMTIISLLLTGQPITPKIRADTIDVYLDAACYSYVTRFRAIYAALRCLLVTVELLRLAGGSSAELAAKWAIKALDLNIRPTVGRALISQRVGDCYAVRQGAGSGGWGGRRRKAAMWHVLAAETWIRLGKFAQARHCIDVAMPKYVSTEFVLIRRFVEQMRLDSGYVNLLDLKIDTGVGGTGEEVVEVENGDEEEALNEYDDGEAEKPRFDGKRRSILIPQTPNGDAPGVMTMDESPGADGPL
ncbi:hypothetical protein TWF569_003626 [Orbilia oligospora]|uniref:Transport protein particle subunit trs85-2 n=1 Tax=Orbilia oligospora TaxID=2813651 RepID=A0A7C8JIT1_ORBOL|nr:hypothetical protein TWF102_005593 [Orbilia oligospora]KAF3101666.1 hypothetical protein TWF706_005433 [Orbilia oligospora]KAF3113633.1 hypothetical protein TWF103_001988 [Orbilia oligospora]KAF3119652.1 hypothetical protein TWF569_003626 [Orbilia oligospora]KAF3126705.1 hypothetical protein TWF703_010388 [Orbilia oligospora]